MNPQVSVIVLSRELPPALLQALQTAGEVRVHAAGDFSALAKASVYCSTAFDPVDEKLIRSFPPGLGLIANIGVGVDNIDLDAATSRGILVSNTPVVTEDTADLAWALILAASRRLSASETLLRQGQWSGALLSEVQGQRVHGKILGIIGLGEIGQAVARRARGFSMKLIYHGPRRKMEAESGLDAGFRANLEDLLAEADIVSLHCPLTDSSRHLINARSLSRMKPNAVLINTGRGPLVDECALVEALAGGHLGAVGLDVFEFEPQVTPALLEFPNVTLLPHIGSATGECRRDMAVSVVTNIKTFLASGKPVNLVT
jgi:glyoxylate reductase